MINERNKIRVFMYGSMIIALVLGAYGQDISHYIYDNIVQLSPLDWLTALTITSILLFLIPPMLMHKLNKKQKIGEKELNLYFGINILIGIMTSLWSLFVLIMSMG